MSSGPNPSTLVLALCGLPGSGKSTLCTSLLACPHFCVHLVSYDQPPTASAAPWTPAQWHTERAASLASVAAALAAPPTSSLPTLVLVDDNAWLRSMRRPLYALARGSSAAYLTLHLRLPAEVAAARDAARGSSAVGAPTIARMAAALQPPTSGWEAPYAWVLDSSALGAEAVLQAVLQRLQGAAGGWGALLRPPPLPTPCQHHTRTLLHSLDLALRAAVARLARSGRGEGQALAAAKARVLQAARGLAAQGELQEALEEEEEQVEEGGEVEVAPEGAPVQHSDGSAGEEAASQALVRWAERQLIREAARKE